MGSYALTKGLEMIAERGPGHDDLGIDGIETVGALTCDREGALGNRFPVGCQSDYRNQCGEYDCYAVSFHSSRPTLRMSVLRKEKHDSTKR